MSNRKYFAYKGGKEIDLSKTKVKPDGSNIDPGATWGYYNSVTFHWHLQGPRTGKYPAKEDLEAIEKEQFTPHMAERMDPAKYPVDPTGITLQTDSGLDEGAVFFDMKEPNTRIDDENCERATVAWAGFVNSLYPSGDPDEDDDEEGSDGDEDDDDTEGSDDDGGADDNNEDDDEPTEPRYCDQTDEEREKDVDDMYDMYLKKYSPTT